MIVMEPDKYSKINPSNMNNLFFESAKIKDIYANDILLVKIDEKLPFSNSLQAVPSRFPNTNILNPKICIVTKKPK